MWNFQWTFKSCANFWEIEETNSGLLSDFKEARRPNHGITSVTRIVVTVEAQLLVVGKASTHPMKVSTSTKRYLIFFPGGIWVKYTCQSMAGRHPLAWWVGKEGGLTLELRFVRWQIKQDWVICLRYCMSPGDRESDWWRKV
jgi:hypothetical protein